MFFGQRVCSIFVPKIAFFRTLFEFIYLLVSSHPTGLINPVFANFGNVFPYLVQRPLDSKLGQSPWNSERLHRFNRGMLNVVCY